MTIHSWTGFFQAQTSAFAALTGLVFVALSINLKTVLELPGAPGRAGEALISLVEPVVLGLAGLVGRQSMTALGVEWTVVGTASWLAVSAILRRGRAAMVERRGAEVLIRLAGVQAASLLVLAAGTLLLAGNEAGLYVQAAGVAACLFIGIVDAWVLLVEILR